ncbi:MAG TPA: hypothetical protein VJI52_01815 [Candidatus Nanoarchaeia archaeon]|nr:hypothetical protein [Candidatus Nanoarchaeia archaeon]
MGFFSIFFKSTGEIAVELNRDNQELMREWRQYISTVPEKKNLANSISIDVVRLNELLKIGLDDSRSEEKKDAEIIKDLRSIKHDQRIARVNRLQEVLDHALSKYRYVYSLLDQIYNALLREYSLARAIAKNNSDIKLIRHLREQIDLELLIIKKVNEMNREHGPGTFARLFSDLARGEAIIKTLDRVGRIHFERMSKGYPSEGSIIEKWMNIVTEAIEGWVEEAVADGTLLDNKFRDHGFVNSPLFDELVRDTIQSLRPGKRVPERMVQIFLEDYRQGFNERIH